MQGGEAQFHYFQKTVRVTTGFSITAFIVGFFCFEFVRNFATLPGGWEIPLQNKTTFISHSKHI